MAGALDGRTLKIRLPTNIGAGGWVWPRRNGRRITVPLDVLSKSALRRLLNKPLKF